MSRLRRLKESRKNTIKTTMASLALVLVIGSTQTMGTYALFKDTLDVTDKLIISTGDVDAKVGEGFKIQDAEPGTTNHDFEIKNNGTLKQNIRIKLDQIKSPVTEHITYSLDFGTYKNKKINPIVGKLSELMVSDGIELRYADDGSLVVLDPNDIIVTKSMITIEESIGELGNEFVSNPMEIKLNILASQINNQNNIQNIGFWDRDIQVNCITFKHVLPTIPNMEEKGKITSKGLTFTINIYEVLQKLNLTHDQIKTIEYVEGGGTFNSQYIKAKFNNQNHLELEKTNGDKFVVNNKEFDENVYIILKFSTDDNRYAEVKFSFRDPKPGTNENSQLDAYYQVLDYNTKINKGPEIVEQPKEEVTAPSEPDAVEPPKEESENVGDSEIVEPPKEDVEKPSRPEVVEPPKEEVVAPSQPDIIAPSKEEIEIQE